MRETKPIWDMNVQRMVNFIEHDLSREIRLENLARRLGYSPFHCTRQFHRVMGMSLRRYVGLRRLTIAAQALRDTDRGILEIALVSGFSSQEALTRAFSREWGCTPGDWRRAPRVITTLPRRGALVSLAHSTTHQECFMTTTNQVQWSFQTLPAQRFIGLRIPGATDYQDFWDKASQRGINCQEVERGLRSLTANAQIGGWYQEPEHGYLYGVEMPVDYSGPIPEGLENLEIPATEYAVFHHPPYDFSTQELQVHEALQRAEQAWSPGDHGRIWRREVPKWQRHDPAGMGQAWCRAVQGVGPGV